MVHAGLVLVFAIAAVMMSVAAVASWFAGGRVVDRRSGAPAGERTGEEPATYALVEGDVLSPDGAS